jgi:hypothetical protein
MKLMRFTALDMEDILSIMDKHGKNRLQICPEMVVEAQD